ncbi:MAG: peptidyl-tRNA hydrolase, peptidyl-tRNA hydrolase, PTH1 family [Candidatus Gottesmanbacteria bacterium GW2011_GWA2_43_14]|uniref:Peptidyl-tRNA hydrolase n=1 Tax=Candidatus Gottesmanbacteria bacterium GW2011_GWA2_43_14 TaxID=1618443 RepID=A0A0G1DK64_9BACT|nr:MAG: peptidyl-tRNA hydrolase, peptidyl-tRNA hydrolase, PTH1 family [Candidatus Gottesmanbacteria bacterium GW2011_GWA2_43_14]
MIVGLGNPEEKYLYNRHNIGYMVVEKLAKVLLPVDSSEKEWIGEKKFTAQLCRVNKSLILVKPHTYMNRSGIAVSALARFYKIEESDLWVIHDDIDLPLGKIRIRKGGSSGGHNGVESIIQHFQSADFIRFRLGIGRGKLDAKKTTDINLSRQGIEKFVLSTFKDSEAGEAKKMIKNAVKAVILTLDKGLEKAMNRFN